MEIYTFTSTENGKFILRIKSDSDTEFLPGFHRIVEKLTECDIVHSFTVIDKIKEENVGEFFYIWYNIENYVCIKDKAAAVSRETTVISENLDKETAITDYNIMMGTLLDPSESEEIENAQ